MFITSHHFLSFMVGCTASNGTATSFSPAPRKPPTPTISATIFPVLSTRTSLMCAHLQISLNGSGLMAVWRTVLVILACPSDGADPTPSNLIGLIADGTRACGLGSRHRQGIDWNFCHFEMVAVVVAEDTTMRATFATAILVTASLMGAVALTSAQNSAGDQEKGLTGWSGGSKDQPSQSSGTGTPGHPTNPNTGKEVEVHDEQQARNQPSLATGKDLKGPATQLAPSKTPE